MSRDGKRIQVVEIPSENIEEYFSGDMAVIEGLPDDIELYRTWDDAARQTYCFAFQSEEFPVVPQGEEPPRAEIVVAERRVNRKDYWVCPTCNETVQNGDVVCGASE